ncbi:helix-turn-helix domain-containing protein [Nocardioides sp. LHD-245]|uniref:helix-turn-helix domain-containing protein n=1 Tax=Nocardioides sp. LHD-245 TaxID=3051387 RepID=UPI0027E13F14|nr:helix-turn-helix domain-containing protein [Nocardioides sp. LHD-245]
MSTSPDLLASVEVCAELNIDRSTLSRWVAAGRIEPATKLPGLRGAFLFARTEVERVKGSDAKAAS